MAKAFSIPPFCTPRPGSRSWKALVWRWTAGAALWPTSLTSEGTRGAESSQPARSAQ